MNAKWHIKDLKRATRKVIKKDYWRMAAICFIMAVVCGLYSGSLSLIDDYSSIRSIFVGDPGNTTTDQTEQTSSLDPYATESDYETIKQIGINIHNGIAPVDQNNDVSQSLAKGISFTISNLLPNKQLNSMFLRFIASAGMKQFSVTVLVFLFFLIIGIAFNIFIKNIMIIGEKRYFMETRTYHDTKLFSLFHVYRLGRIKNAVWVMLCRVVFQILWMFTIVGGPIKYYEYSMIPFILAENPDIDRKTAFKISKGMMKGQKWHAFCLTLSYLGWYVLGALSFGLVQVFYSNFYETGAWTELYMELRKKYIDDKGVGADKLCDVFLTLRPSDIPESQQKGLTGSVSAAFSEMKTGLENLASLVKSGAIKLGSGVKADFTEAVNADKAAQVREKGNSYAAKIKSLDPGDVYPYGLSPVQPTERMKKRLLTPIRADRKYSLTSYILLFFIFSFVGWIWEVTLHLAQTGEFVNRGSLTGPWLPIYGTGGVLVLLLMRRWLKRPIVTFVMTTVVCVVVEYFTALVMWEIWHKKWWDYSMEFMNFQGRICLKGALAFGIGGMAFIYFFAPRIDDMIILKIPKKISVILCVVLLAIIGCDVVNSALHPHTGEGITSMMKTSPDEILEQTGIYIKQRFHRMQHL